MCVLWLLRPCWDLMHIKVEDNVGFANDLKIFEARFFLEFTHRCSLRACVVGVNMPAGLKPEAKFSVLDQENTWLGRMKDKCARGEVSWLELCATTGSRCLDQ